MSKSCRKCDAILIVGDNWKPSSEKRKDYICSECRKPLLVRDKLVIKESTIKEYGGKLNMGGGHQFYYWLKKQGYPKANYQVLCFNCNFAKHAYGKCPHQS